MQWRKLVSATVSFFLTLILVFYIGVTPASAATMTQLKEQQAVLETEKKQSEQALNQLKKDSENKVKYRDALKKLIDVSEKETDVILQRIEKLTAEDEAAEVKITEAQSRVSENYKLIKNQCLWLNLPGSASLIYTIIADKKTFSDYAVSFKEYSSCTAEQQKIIKAISEDTEYIYKAKADIAANSKEIERIKNTLEVNSKELSELYEESKKLADQAQKTQEEAEKEAQLLKAEKEKTDKAIDEWYYEYITKQAAANGGSVSNIGGDAYTGVGDFIWPIPSYTEITCYFGDDGHRGIDVAGSDIYGKAILAADDGVVAYSGVMGTYGKVVFIDHGNGYQTRYAHMSVLGCVEGDTVTKGQVIGYVGSTGNSTGPHLHYEILFDGQLMNPFIYY